MANESYFRIDDDNFMEYTYPRNHQKKHASTGSTQSRVLDKDDIENRSHLTHTHSTYVTNTLYVKCCRTLLHNDNNVMI